jgi:hypothetical protein
MTSADGTTRRRLLPRAQRGSYFRANPGGISLRVRGALMSYLAGTIFRTATAVSGAGPSSPEMRHVVIMGSPT